MILKQSLRLFALASLGTLVPLATWGQSLPTTLVAQKKDNVEHCYEIGKIEKLTFQEGKLHFVRIADAQQFTPEAHELTAIEKLFFATDKQPNEAPEVRPEGNTQLRYTLHEGLLTITGFAEVGATLSLYTTEGRLVHRGEVVASSYTVDVSSLPLGFYFLSTSHSETLKIVLQ